VEYDLEEDDLVVAQVQEDLPGDGAEDPAHHHHLLHPGEETQEALTTLGRAGAEIREALVTLDRAREEVGGEGLLVDPGLLWVEEDLLDQPQCTDQTHPECPSIHHSAVPVTVWGDTLQEARVMDTEHLDMELTGEHPSQEVSAGMEVEVCQRRPWVWVLEQDSWEGRL